MDLLLGYGGGDADEDALSRTLARVAETGDDLTVAVFRAAAVDASLSTLEAEVLDRVADASGETDVRRIASEPGSELVALAHREGYDRILLSGRSRSPLGKITLDDVTEFVLLNSEVSVTLLR